MATIRPEHVAGWSVALISHVLAVAWLTLPPPPAPVPVQQGIQLTMVDLLEPAALPVPEPPVPAEPEPVTRTPPESTRPTPPPEPIPPVTPIAPPVVDPVTRARRAAIGMDPASAPSQATQPPATVPPLPPDRSATVDATAVHPGAGAGATSVVEHDWQAIVLRHLDRFLRYPSQARRFRQDGITLVRFRVDRQGKVLAVELADSSGHEALDSEALAVVTRAQPLPPPPDALGAGASVEVVVPVQFRLRRR